MALQNSSTSRCEAILDGVKSATSGLCSFINSVSLGMFLIWISSANISLIPFASAVNMSSIATSKEIVVIHNKLLYCDFGFCTSLQMFSCEIITPFGFPVEPDV